MWSCVHGHRGPWQASTVPEFFCFARWIPIRDGRSSVADLLRVRRGLNFDGENVGEDSALGH